MERLAMQDLIRWKNNPRRKPLMVWGARQAGKTYLVRDQFAEMYYPGRYVYIDFRLEKSIREYCSGTVDPQEIVRFVSVEKNTSITQDTLIIFDEIQECPAIITALKYFCQNAREYPVIATGSMVRIQLWRLSHKRGAKQQESYLFPVGKINELTLYPMTFEEFLLNRNPSLLESIHESWFRKLPLDQAYHELAMKQLYDYLLVGGMPEALDVFLETGDYRAARTVIEELYNNYLDDMELYQASPESVMRSKAIFRHIYGEMNKENKDFRSSLVEEKAKTRDMKTPIDWLTTAHVVHQSWQLPEHVTSPLIRNNESSFRLYLHDIGMFSYESGENASSFLLGQQQNTLSGIFFENYAANELIAKKIPLYYWKGKNSAEMEFVVDSGNRIIPIDVKRGRGTLNSLVKFRNHNKSDLAIKLSANRFGYAEDQKLLTVPLYACFLLAEDLKEGRDCLRSGRDQ
ncbi:MAG: ATP-binding protein [Clostridia bacterium]|nr:ATP-binding protein [Clostridia bacterium]